MRTDKLKINMAKSLLALWEKRIAIAKNKKIKQIKNHEKFKRQNSNSNRFFSWDW